MKKLLILLTLFTAAPAFAASFTPEQEVRIREMIRETLVENPAILAEAADAWQKQSVQAQNSQVAQVIQKNKQVLFDDPGSPRLGAAKPALTLVYFTDYNCVFCKKFEGELERLMKDHPDIAVVIKPLPYRSETSLRSAQLALTVWEQQPEKFKALHDRLMAKKGYHDSASIEAAIIKTGQTVKQPSQRSLETINLNLSLAQQLGIQGTPATLIGNQLVSGAVPYEQLEEQVKATQRDK